VTTAPQLPGEGDAGLPYLAPPASGGCDDELWNLGVAEACTMGCSYPCEPAGVYARLLHEASTRPSKTDAQRLIAINVMACDACHGYCTVQTPNS